MNPRQVESIGQTYKVVCMQFNSFKLQLQSVTHIDMVRMILAKGSAAINVFFLYLFFTNVGLIQLIEK